MEIKIMTFKKQSNVNCHKKEKGNAIPVTGRGGLQPLAHAGFSLADFSTLKIEVIRSSETSVHTRSTRCHIPEEDILQFYTRFQNIRH
jgi:hypothetical protein